MFLFFRRIDEVIFLIYFHSVVLMYKVNTTSLMSNFDNDFFSNFTGADALNLSRKKIKAVMFSYNTKFVKPLSFIWFYQQSKSSIADNDIFIWLNFSPWRFKYQFIKKG